MKSTRTHWLLSIVLLGLFALLTACAPPAAAPPAPATMPVPELTTIPIEISADGLTMPADIVSGVVAIEVQNNGGPEGFPELARLNDDATLDQLNAALASGDDMAALALVTLNGAPNKSADNKVIYDLEPGNYVAILFSEDGPPLMTSFTSSEPSGASAPAADVTVQLVDFQFALPDEIKAGQNIWQIENKGEQWHEMGILKLHEGMTIDDMMAWMESAGPAGPSGPPPFEDVAFWSPMGAGKTAWVTWDIPAGEYTVICFLPDLVGDGAPHFAHGMVRTLTVTE